MDRVTVLAPAKVNLTLDVKGKRADGYHNIESVMHQINLCDTVFLSKAEEGITVLTNHPELSDQKENLAYRAALMVCDRCAIKTGIRITIEKNIPVGAGLAGGSTDAAAVIKGLIRLFGLNLSWQEMMEIGEGLGSDVPFCLLGETALAQGKGEILTPVANKLQIHLVLVNPGFSVSTSKVYSLLDDEIIYHRPDSLLLVKSLEEGNLLAAIENMGNVMEAVTLKLHPELKQIKQKLMKMGAGVALMTGSGPSLFGVFPDYSQAEAAFYRMKKPYSRTFLISSYTEVGDKS